MRKVLLLASCLVFASIGAGCKYIGGKCDCNGYGDAPLYSHLHGYAPGPFPEQPVGPGCSGCGNGGVPGVIGGPVQGGPIHSGPIHSGPIHSSPGSILPAPGVPGTPPNAIPMGIPITPEPLGVPKDIKMK